MTFPTLILRLSDGFVDLSDIVEQHWYYVIMHMYILYTYALCTHFLSCMVIISAVIVSVCLKFPSFQHQCINSSKVYN